MRYARPAITYYFPTSGRPLPQLPPRWSPPKYLREMFHKQMPINCERILWKKSMLSVQGWILHNFLSWISRYGFITSTISSFLCIAIYLYSHLAFFFFFFFFQQSLESYCHIPSLRVLLEKGEVYPEVRSLTQADCINLMSEKSLLIRV